MTTTVAIHDSATPAIAGVARELASGKTGGAIGPAVVKFLQRHFRALESSRPNKLGGKRTHFWSAAAKSTHWTQLADGVVVSVSKQGVRQRLLGGEIKPVNKKFLAIPAIAEAYGKRAGEFTNLFARFGKSGHGGALIDKATGQPFFWLVKRVFQRADPTVMPTTAELTTVATGAADAHTKRLAARAARKGANGHG